ncbi:heavy metal translocating P-type ATPase [Niveibacterium microcysteis]|uniref:P-type Zn(2+) transporter n=1 Tax=Niveibacterium microcysteis TaxID=2811415 RepID=A0ABX7M8W9_9RHOO|nr:cation-translocating P-type ATPase [Niveibacterium microcysteis]QSI78187.1 cation-translocating P-type ATPase [Niveibacterium microcysteis]
MHTPSELAILTAQPAPCSGGCCQHAVEGATPATVPEATRGARFRIPSMDCPVEEGEIRRALDAVPGIRALRFELAQRQLTIDADERVLAAALSAIRAAGFDATPAVEGAEPAARATWLAEGWPRLVAALLLAIGAEALGYFAPAGRVWQVAGMSLGVAAIALAGLGTFRKGWSALRQGRLNINALMSVAVTGAFLIGQWPEAAMVMALYAIAELIEARAVDRARNAIAGLMSLAPAEAEVQASDGSWRTVAAAEVLVGARVRVGPGQRMPLDGVVVAGTSSVDQSPLTGESLPVEKVAGDAVFAGTINLSGGLEFTCTAGADDSLLARIIHAVEAAQSTRAPMQGFIDRFARIYTPAVFVISSAVALFAPLLLGWGWTQALYKALVLLVIACPCALVISTPVTIVSGLAAAARRGILIKGGRFLEEARRLRAVALDKTGTVTEGKPRLVHWEALSNSDPIAVGASLAARSDHPVSQAIAAGLPDHGLAVEGFVAEPGRGVRGTIEGHDYVLGKHSLIHDMGLCDAALEARLAEHEAQGRTVTLLASEHAVLALFAVADTIKSGAAAAVTALRAQGVEVVMLSGDNTTTARAIATQAGITNVRGDLMPEDKLCAVQALQAEYGATAMVGDGINDAPALAAADVGFAMGGVGTDIAMEAADIVIMTDELHKLADTLALSRRTYAVLWQNIALALGVKGVFLVLALFGSATMWMAVFADMGASLLVVANGLRMLRPARDVTATAFP